MANTQADWCSLPRQRSKKQGYESVWNEFAPRHVYSLCFDEKLGRSQCLLWCRFAATFTLDNFEPPAFAALNLSHPSHPRMNTYRTKSVLRCVAEAGVSPRGNTSDFLKTQTVLTAHPLFSWKYVLSFVKKSYTLHEESCVRVITSATLIDNTRVRQFHFANPIIVQCSIQLLY